MIYTIQALIWLLAGVAKGICDSIEFHDSYRDWGYDFSKDSWYSKYSHPTWFSKLLDASINAWHILDWSRTLLVVISVGLALLYPIEVTYIPFLLFAFVLGFKISYR